MKEINVTGQKRTDLGKKASKSLRKEGFIPCNLYGEKKDANGAPEAMSFAVPFTELRKIIYTPHVYVINLIIDGESHTAIMKEIQFHPTTDAPLHVDFYEVNDQKPITIGIPVKLVGLAQGVRDGGRMNLSLRKINVTAPYQVIPEHLERVGDRGFLYAHHIATFNDEGGFTGYAAYSYSAVLAGIGSNAASLVNAGCPKPLVYSCRFFHDYFFPSLLYWFMVISIPANTKLLMISTPRSMAG